MTCEVAVFGFTMQPATYTYLIPPGLKLIPGQVVAVPFGKRTSRGVVIRLNHGDDSDFKLRQIERALTDQPVLTNNQLQLAEFIAQYYYVAIGEAVKLFLPRFPKSTNITALKTSQELLIFPTLHQAEAVKGSGTVFTHNVDAQSFDQLWQSISSGRTVNILGSRSTLFAPYANLKKITIFQTESDLYKDERRPYYRTLRLAQELARISGAKLQAISYSPRVQDHYDLPHQIKKLTSLPKSQVVNLRKYPIVNDQLIDTLVKAKAKKVLLFLNRKSESGALVCRTCKVRSFVTDPTTCPNCGSHDVKFQLINLRTISNQITKKGVNNVTYATQKIFFEDSGQFDQIVVLSADTYLNRGTYTASEQTFQMLTSLMRLLTPQGTILIQTAHEDQPAIKMALKNDYAGFYETELKVRQDTGYPPYTKLAKLTWAKQSEPSHLNLSGSLAVFGPFQSKFPYFIVRGQDLTELNKLTRPWKLDIDPASI